MPRTAAPTARPNPFAEVEPETADNRGATGYDPAPSAEAPTAEELAGRRLLDLHGPVLLDAYREKIDALTESLQRDHSDPYGDHFDRYRDCRVGFAHEKRPPIRLRHELIARLAGLEAVRDGRPWAPINEAQVEEATARDLITQFVWASKIQNPAEALLSALATRIQRLLSRLAQARESLSDAALMYLPSTPDQAVWTRLEGLYRGEAEASERVARACAARDHFGPALARHFGTAIDEAGGDEAVALGLSKVAPPAPLPAIEDDPEIIGLTAEVNGARRHIDALGVAAAKAGDGSTTKLEELRNQLTGDAETRLAERYRQLRAEHAAAVAQIPIAYASVVDGARAGDAAAWWKLVSAPRAHPAAFHEGFSDRLVEAVISALTESGAVEFSTALAPATD